MDKPVTQKAWFLVLSVVQDTFGSNVLFWTGLEWFRQMLQDNRMWDALGRQPVF